MDRLKVPVLFLSVEKQTVGLELWIKFQ